MGRCSVSCFLAAGLLLMMGSGAPAAPLKPSSPSVDSLLASARMDVEGLRREDKADQDLWKKARYIQIVVGGKSYLYTMNGKLVIVQPTRARTAGIRGQYGEISWELLDERHKMFCDLYSYTLFRFNGRTWQMIARNGGTGYDESTLKKAHVPPSLLKRL